MSAHDDVDVTTPDPAPDVRLLPRGSHNFAADREAADRAIALMPDAVPIALHFVPDSDDPVAVLAAYRARLVPGSLVVPSHATVDLDERARTAAATYRSTSSPLIMRSLAEVTALLAGLDLVEPGIVEASAWRPEPDVPPSGVSVYAAVGRVSHQP